MIETCKICNLSFKNMNVLSAHITKKHKDITQQQYYHTYIETESIDHICPTCGKKTDFISIRYGYKLHCSRLCSNKDKSIINQRHTTLNNTYGHPFTRSDVIDKCRATIKDKYNVDNPYQIASVKAKSHTKEALEKHYQTLKRNGTFKKSKQEDFIYNILTTYFDTVLRNYKSNLYPYRCDFYIPDINTYIECNFHWTHGGHWFDSNSVDDINIVNNWSNRSQYFDNAINTWTTRDVEKRNCAKNNKLNYVVLWTKEDIQDWIDSGFEVRHDY